MLSKELLTLTLTAHSSSATSAILTELARKNIPVKDVIRDDKGLTLTLRRCDEPILRGIALDYSAEVKIVRLHGLHKMVNLMRLRGGLMIGVLLGIIVVIVLSNFVMRIDINVDNDQYYGKIEQTIKQLNVKVGSPLNKIDNATLERAILEVLEESAFVTVYTRGVVLYVNVVSEPNTQHAPADKENLTATIDAVVTRIVVSSGTAVVKVADRVKVGDVLIGGYININKDPYAKPSEEQLVNVAAEGEVYGRVYHHVRIFYNENTILTRKTGEKKVRRDMYIGKTLIGKNHKVPYTKYESTASYSTINVLFPIKVATYTYYEIEEYTLEEAAYREMSIAEARAKIIEELPHGGKVIKEEIIPSNIDNNIYDFYMEVEQRIDNGGQNYFYA